MFKLMAVYFDFEGRFGAVRELCPTNSHTQIPTTMATMLFVTALTQQQLSVGTLGAVLLKKTDSITKILTNNVGVLTVLVILGWVVRTYHILLGIIYHLVWTGTSAAHELTCMCFCLLKSMRVCVYIQVPLQLHPFLGPNWTGGGFVGISWTIWFRLFNAVVYTLTIMLFETVTEETVVSPPIIYTGFKNLFSHKIFYTLAQLSYGIFLMHTSYVVTILYFKGTKVNGDNFSVSLWLWKGLCLSVTMVLLSLAANVFVEKPLRKVRKFVIATLFPGEGAKKMI